MSTNTRNFLVVAAMWVTISMGCSGTGGNLPNLYQPVTDNPTACSEIEYRWVDSAKDKSVFYPGKGDFCTYVDSISVRARCVTRDDNGNITYAGSWVDAEYLEEDEFYALCPEADPDRR